MSKQNFVQYRKEINNKQPSTLVLLKTGLDIVTSAVCIAVLLFGQASFNLAVVNFTLPLVFQLGSGSSLGVIKYSTCS